MLKIRTSIFLLPIILLSSISNLYAQNDEYIPMVQDNANWIYYYQSPNSEEFLYGYTILGDTIVDGVEYKKLHYRTYNHIEENNAPPNWWPDGPFEYLDEYVMGFIREDTMARQVYCKIVEEVEMTTGNCSIGDEFLMFDFGLSVNDTLHSCVVPVPDFVQFVINDIYVEESYGLERRFFENNEVVEEVFIEGVGSTFEFFSLVNTPVTANFSQYLVDYCLGTDEECNQFPTSIKNIVADADINVYPNPVSDQLRIKVSDNYSVNDFEIVNTLGQTVESGSFDVNNPQIGMYQMESGWYVLLLHTDDSTLRKTFVVK